MKRQWIVVCGLVSAALMFTYVQAEDDAATEPAVEQTVEPAVEQVVEPAVEAAAEPAAEPADETAVEPAADAAEPALESGATEEASGAFATLEQKMSYIIGMNIGREFKQNSLDIDLAALNAGLSDAMDDKPSLLSEEQMQETMMAMQQQMMAKMQAVGDKNLAEGKAYLEANGGKEGVITLESGLQYKVLQSGDGATPQLTDTVSVHYRGSLIDGSDFETSYGKEPLTIPVQGVIPGWTEALQKMKVGDKWQLFIPSELGYGARGGPGGPNSVLVFEVELLAIQ